MNDKWYLAIMSALVGATVTALLIAAVLLMVTF